MKKKSALETEGVSPQEIIDSLPQWILRINPKGEILYANSAFCHYVGKSIQQILKENIAHLVSPTRMKQINIDLEHLRQVQPELHWLLKDSQPATGGGRWEYWVDHAIFSPSGELTSVQCTGFEILNPSTLSSEPFALPSEFQALHDATAALLSTLDLEKLLGQIVDMAVRAVPAADKGLLYLIARDTGELEMRAMLGYTPSDSRIKRFVNPNDYDYIAIAVQTQSPLMLNNLTDSISSEEGTRDACAQSAIIAPLILEGHTLGALVLEASRQNAFSDRHLRLLTTFATTATAAIRNAQLHAEVQKIAITDALTGLYNRRGLFELGEREVERAHRFNRPLACIMLDIDGFKRINDTFGHAAGDKILRYVAEQCKTHTRKIDILGRYGGDEFTILLLESGEHLANGVANRLQELVSATPIQLDKEAIHVTISTGVATLKDETPDLDALLQAADRQLYQAKQKIKDKLSK